MSVSSKRAGRLAASSALLHHLWAGADCTRRRDRNQPVTRVEADGVAVFRGIPYAASPVGDFRWLRPNRQRRGPVRAMRPSQMPEDLRLRCTYPAIGSSGAGPISGALKT